ncbi:MAG: hypothetical protein ACYSTN_07580 [Planctomycetota bacterium]
MKGRGRGCIEFFGTTDGDGVWFVGERVLIIGYHLSVEKFLV